MKKIFLLFIKIIELPLAIKAHLQKRLFKKCGKKVHIGYGCEFNYSNISVGNNVFIGNRASFIAGISKIHIGNNVMFGPGVTIRGGNHRIDLVGRLMISVKNHEKSPTDDQDVLIEDDVWVGCNSTILKGVTISKGAVIAACSVVTKSVPQYSIVAGNPAKVIKLRFNDNEIIEHENKLNIKEYF